MQMQISHARRYFEEMGCSHFHMSRDDPDMYSQYRALNISTDQERSWRRERINAIAASLTASASPDWSPFAHLIDLCEHQRDVESLQTLERAIDSSSANLPPRDSVIVAEQLIGTATYHYDQGPIFLAIQLKQEPLARKFAETALTLVSGTEARAAEPARSAAAVQKCAAVRKHFRI